MKSGHKVVIQIGGFWHKKHRYMCLTCGETGNWYKSIVIPTAQGWFHDDVTLFELLTKKPDQQSDAA